MLDMTCNSTDIYSYSIKQHKPKQDKYPASLPHFNEVWQNQPLQPNTLCCEQSPPNQNQLTSSPTLHYLLQQGKKRTENRSTLNVSQAKLYNSTYNNQYESQYHDQIAPCMSNQVASSAPIQPQYQPAPMISPSVEQRLQYQQHNIYYENRQSYLSHNTYSNNYNSLPMTPTATTPNLRSPVVRPSQEILQKNNLYVTQQYVVQQNYMGNNNEQQSQIAANNQESFAVRPPQGVPQENNLYATQQYIVQQNYMGNNSEQQSHIAANNQESSVVRQSLGVLQKDNIYATPQYVMQQSYAGNNNEPQSRVAPDDSKSEQQQIQPYAWMKFKHDPGNENKRARKRQTYTQEQTFRLEEVFYGSRYLSKAERVKLSTQLKLSEQQIKIWFQNRRMKAKKEQQQLSVNKRPKFNETPIQDQSISQQKSIIHQQQSTVQQQQPNMQQQWPTAQQAQLHQTHQDYQNCSQQHEFVTKLVLYTGL